MTADTPHPAQVDFGEGDRVRLRREVERFPHFTAPMGAEGTAVEVSDSLIRVRMDKTLKGAEEWDNEVCWSVADGDEVGLDAEPLPTPRAAGSVEPRPNDPYCPRCGSVDISGWAEDGESDDADFGECNECKWEGPWSEVPTVPDRRVAADADFIGAGDDVVVLSPDHLGLCGHGVLVDAAEEERAIVRVLGTVKGSGFTESEDGSRWVTVPFARVAHPDSPLAEGVSGFGETIAEGAV